MSEKIVQLNEEVIKGQVKELVRGSVEETLNELLEREAESLTQAARYERNETRQGYRSGHYDRNLTTSYAPHAAAQGRVLRDSHHRAVSSPEEQRGGSPHRDVSGRRLRAPGGGHHRGTVGQQGVARYHQRTEQESLCSHRGLAQPPVTGRALSIHLCGRHLPAPQLGRRVRKCFCFSGDRRE